MNHKTIAITFPIYIKNEDHLYFTEKTLDSISTKHDVKIITVVNYVEPSLEKQTHDLLDKYDVEVIKNTTNNVSGAWNLGIKTAFAHGIDYVLIPNNDIVIHPACIDNLVKFAYDTKDEFVLWSAAQHANLRTLKLATIDDSYDNHPGFSFFMVTRDGVNKMIKAEEGTGEPDPGFFDIGYVGAYFEDQDYHQRILRAGFDGGKTASSIYYHFGSRTISVDRELNDLNGKTYEHNRRYFEEKWGYDSHGKGFSNEERIQHGNKTAFSN